VLGVALKVAADALLARRLRGRALPVRSLLAIPLKDLLIAGVWLIGAFRRTILWRGNRLRIGHGSVLSLADPAEATSAIPLAMTSAHAANAQALSEVA
nr:hypothetical protein [Acidobacteriota bacterium]